MGEIEIQSQGLKRFVSSGSAELESIELKESESLVDWLDRERKFSVAITMKCSATILMLLA